MAKAGKPSLVVRPKDSRTTITMLETKNVTIHAVGSASNSPQAGCAVPSGARSHRAISARLHFGPHRRAALDLVGAQEPEDVLVLQVLDPDLAGGASFASSANAGSASFTGNG